jgi:hypothetical protein
MARHARDAVAPSFAGQSRQHLESEDSAANTGAMSSEDADFAEWKRSQFEQARRLRQDLDKQQRRLEKLGVFFSARNGEPSGILVKKKDDGAPGVHEDFSDITAADRYAPAADQAVTDRAR